MKFRAASLCFFAFLCCCVVQAALPATITFGQSSPFSSVIKEIGPRLQAGVLAAFAEVNKYGGVKNSTILQLVSMDDQYLPDETAKVVPQLLAIPDMFAFIGFYGSATTEVALPFIKEAKIPCIGPLTGSSVFRRIFNPYTINLRAGYDDEAMAMLNLILNVKLSRRIAILYQDDAFGAPAKNAIVEALKTFGMELVYMLAYDRTKPVTNFNFDQVANDFSASKPQAIILYSVGEWTTGMIKYMKAREDPNHPITFTTGSWMGLGLSDRLKEDGTSVSNVYVTQTFPHPLSEDYEITAAYRAAMAALEPTPTYDYFSLEGYVSGRFAIEVLSWMDIATREEFLNTVYRMRMFLINDLLAGPFSRDCLEPDAQEGRSSLCECNQGMRFVHLTEINEEYKFSQVNGSSLTFPISDCFATARTVLTLPTIFLQVYNSTFEGERNANSLQRGMLAAAKKEHQLLQESFNAQNASEFLGREYELIPFSASVGSQNVHSEVKFEFPVIGSIVTPALPASNEFVRNTIHILPTLQQELFAAANYISLQHAIRKVFVMYKKGYDSSIVDLVEKTVTTFRLEFVASSEFDTLSNKEFLKSSIAGGGSGNLFIFGLESDQEMSDLLHFARSNSHLLVFLPYVDLISHWETITSYTTVCDHTILERFFVSTNVPSWVGNEYAAALADITGKNQSQPLEMLGFFISEAVEYVLQRMGNLVTPSSLMTTWYQTSIVVSNGVKLGPYVDRQCAAENCLCNVGARYLSTYSIDVLLSGKPGVVLELSSCYLKYTRPAEVKTTMSTGSIIGMVAGILILFSVAVFAWYFARMKLKTLHAPKNEALKIYMMLVTLKNETILWERHPNEMNRAISVLTNMIRSAVGRHKCYEVKLIGGSFMIVAKDGTRILSCAAEIQEKVHKYNWKKILSARANERGTDKGTDKVTESSGHTPNTREQQSSSKRDESFSDALSQSSRASSSSSSTIMLGIGVHAGSGTIIFNEEHNTYDYTGPVLAVAAKVADIAQGRQTLVSDSGCTGQYTDKCFEYFYSTLLDNDEELRLLQFNPPGQEARQFAQPVEEANVDSVAAALEQQSNGVTVRNITVLSVYLHDMISSAQSKPKDQVAKEYLSMMTAISALIVKEKGHFVSFVSGRLTVTFNAIGPTPHHAARAAQVAFALRHIFQSTMSCGIATGKALVGPFVFDTWRHDAILGPVAETAVVLEKMCSLYGVSVLTTSHNMDELSSFVYLQSVDIIQPQHASKPIILVGVMEQRDQGPMDEWMYELEKSDASDPFAVVNMTFKTIAEDNPQKWTAAAEVLQELSGQAADLPGARRGRAILAEQSLEAYLHSRQELFSVLHVDRAY